MPNKNNFDYDNCPPNAEAMVESIRSLGYDLGIAIADIIDNSISANANKIWILYEWQGHDSYISISDNGQGMTEDELFEAMRLGTFSPTENRNENDLGRFGLGLKTASFSQCRLLSVKSKSKSEKNAALRKWDLDLIVEKKGWFLQKITDAKSEKLMDVVIKNLDHGTAVLWQNMDRLIEYGDGMESNEDYFYEKINYMKKYIGMIFHRYLTGPTAIDLYCCHPSKKDAKESKVQPWDPFVSNKSRKLDKEVLLFQGKNIEVKPFVLPHHSKFRTNEQFEKAAGPLGWNRHQGFYIYRNRRMLVAGGWLNFYKQEDHYKLARIILDIPNTMDLEWKIGVKKATVFPPDSLKKELKRIAKLTREEACTAYRFRGKLDKRGNPDVEELIWKRFKRRDRIDYKIEKKHPVIQTLIDKTDKALVYNLIDLIEKTIPIETIVVSEREFPDSHLSGGRSLEKETLPILEWYDFYLKKFMDDLDISEDAAFEKLSATEPFNLYKEELETIRGVTV